MILLTKTQETLNCPTSTLFTFTTNMENYPQWFPGVQSVHSLDSLPCTQIGKQYNESLNLPAGQADIVLTVVKVIKNKLFTTEGDLLPLQPMMSMRFLEKDDHHCQFFLEYYSRNTALSEAHDLIKSIKKDLSYRITKAIENLDKITKTRKK